MGKGITIKISRIIERRKRRKDEVGCKVWTGTCWRSLDCLPFSPELAWIYGTEPEVITTPIEFLPPGVIPHDALLYRQTLLPKIRAMGVIK